jgi:hypothetical protein
MANRALLAKVERATTQKRELGNAEYLKPDYISAPKITSAELIELCRGVKVTKIVPTKCMYARGARTWNKRAGTCERRLWIGKPPRI